MGPALLPWACPLSARSAGSAAACPAAWGWLAAEPSSGAQASGELRHAGRGLLPPMAVYSWIPVLGFLHIVSPLHPSWVPRDPASGSPQQWVVKIYLMS